MKSQRSLLIIKLNIFAFISVSLIASFISVSLAAGSTPTTPRCIRQDLSQPVQLRSSPGGEPLETRFQAGAELPRIGETQDGPFGKGQKRWTKVTQEGWVPEDAIEPCDKNRATSKA